MHRVAPAAVLSLFLLAVGSALAHADRPANARATAPSASTAPTFFITGRGWGHGVGMSQYGALGYAQRGTGYARILAHYYRGTTIARAPIARVRVLLRQGAKSATIASKAPFRVREASGQVHRGPAGRQTIGPGLKVKVEGE